MKEIGKTLKERRGHMNLSLSDVHKATKVQEKYLAAIEEGDLSVFKAEVYYKSFLRSYSKYLGFDTEEFVELFNAQKRERREIEESSKLEESSLNDTKNIVYTKKIFIVITIIVSIALAVTFMYLYKHMSNISQSDISKQLEDETMEQEYDVIATTQYGDGIVFEDNTLSAKASTKQNLEIEAKEIVWIKVDVDGKTVYEGTLPKGTRKIWEADNLFILKVGYASGIKVFFNGEPIDVLSGSVQGVNTIVLKKKQT
jgi:cytoskeletal protein RodZ